MTIAETQQVYKTLLTKHKQLIDKRDGAPMKIAILKTSWYPKIMTGLQNSAFQYLEDLSIGDQCLVSVTQVPGSFEIPLVAKKILSHHDVDLLVVLGCIIKGETSHFDFLSQSVIQEIMDLQVKSMLPIGMGILTVDDESQAEARFSKGAEAMQAALDVYLTLNNVSKEYPRFESPSI